MEFTLWEFLILLTRWGLYVSMSAAIGGACSLHLMKPYSELKQPLLRYTLIAVVVAISAAVAHFLIRVGAAMEEGVIGMFEPEMVMMMWDSPVGAALFLRASGLLMLLLAVLIHFIIQKHSIEENTSLSLPEAVVAIVGFGLIASSFTQAGHAVEQHVIFHVVLAVHILLTAWWMGSLYPLWLVCHRKSFSEAFLVLEKFGQLAVGAVLLLFSGGLYMSYLLTGWDDLLTSSYGVFFIIKVSLVFVILMLAALHKLVLVPQLIHSKNSRKLKNSILIEKLVGASIFAITTVLSTLVGPVH